MLKYFGFGSVVQKRMMFNSVYSAEQNYLCGFGWESCLRIGKCSSTDVTQLIFSFVPQFLHGTYMLHKRIWHVTGEDTYKLQS